MHIVPRKSASRIFVRKLERSSSIFLMSTVETCTWSLEIIRCALETGLTCVINIRGLGGCHQSDRTGISAWASCRIRKIAGCACTVNDGNVSPRRRLQMKPLVSDSGMHHGTCVTHVPRYMSGSLIRGGGENVPGIPSACATRNFTYVTRGPLWEEMNYQQYMVPSTLCYHGMEGIFALPVLCERKHWWAVDSSQKVPRMRKTYPCRQSIISRLQNVTDLSESILNTHLFISERQMQSYFTETA